MKKVRKTKKFPAVAYSPFCHQKTAILSFLVVAFLLASILFLNSCASGKGLPAFTEKDSGSSVTVKSGQEFTIKLESNMTTGYSWQLSDKTDSSVISFASSEYAESEKEENVVGSGGFETFTFKAAAPGQTEIILEYVRPWEENVEPEKIFNMTVNVQ